MEMIDWISAQLLCNHQPIPTGKVLRLTPEGEIQYEFSTKHQIRGSYESSILVSSHGSDGAGNATHIHIDGNPSKFLQGHNVFGTNDLASLMSHLYVRICCDLNLPFAFDSDGYQAVHSGDYTITRIDINEAFELDSLENARAWLKASESHGRTRHGRAISKGSTVYFGKGSRRWAIKFYSKYDELQVKGRGLPSDFIRIEHKIKSWAKTKVRAELTLRSLELRDLGLEKGHAWNVETVERIYKQYMGRIQMNTNVVLPTNKALDLPRHLQSTYLLWKQGQDVISILPKATFYRQRKALLKFGIDITFRCNESEPVKSAPVLQLLIAKPATTPDWAHEKALVFDTTNSATFLKVAQ